MKKGKRKTNADLQEREKKGIIEFCINMIFTGKKVKEKKLHEWRQSRRVESSLFVTKRKINVKKNMKGGKGRSWWRERWKEGSRNEINERDVETKIFRR